MNGVIGGLAGKNFESSNEDCRSEIVKYCASTHKYLTNADVDYFIFSWEKDLEDTYKQVYNPKKILSVDQIVFDMPEHFIAHKDNPRIQAHYSRWYGAKQVMQLCTQYSNETGVEYDLIVNARLDLCFHNNIDLRLDNGKFHIAKPINLQGYNWPGGLEFIDHIFATNTESMRNFLQMYDHLDEYTKPDQCPRWKLISNHFLSVWHLRKIGMLQEDTVKESFTVVDNGFAPEVDYHIFRYKNITKEQLTQQYEL